MDIILKHLNGEQQYRFLQGLFTITGMLQSGKDYSEIPQRIQAIMNEVNDKNR